MRQNYAEALHAVLKHEGGYVNHPKDPGGATNKGITQGTYDSYRVSQGSQRRSVKLLETSELNAIYKSRYWDAIKGDDLPSGIDYAVFDFAVNSGPTRAARYLQSVLQQPQDGWVGPGTLKAAKASLPSAVINKLCDNRLAFLQRLDTWPTFGKGWAARVGGVRAMALGLAKRPYAAPPSIPATPVAPTPTKPPVAPPVGLWAWLKSIFS